MTILHRLKAEAEEALALTEKIPSLPASGDGMAEMAEVSADAINIIARTRTLLPSLARTVLALHQLRDDADSVVCEEWNAALDLLDSRKQFNRTEADILKAMPSSVRWLRERIAKCDEALAALEVEDAGT